MTKILGWLFFNAFIPLLPVAIVIIINWFQKLEAKKIFEIIKDGQIFFYCTAITSVAMGDLGRVPKSFEILPWIMGMLVILALSWVAFAVAANDKSPVDADRFGWSSVATAFATIGLVLSFRYEAGLL